MLLKSGLYSGFVRHRRFNKAKHEFSYKLSMFALDLDEVDLIADQQFWFGRRWFNPVRFKQSDYVKLAHSDAQIKTEPLALKQRIKQKVVELGGNWSGDKVVMLAQCRGLGLYFSPVNFYFCYEGEILTWMLAEVSNTPWNERHFYLVDMQNTQDTDKCFHVSPFMNLDMRYVWRINLSKGKALVHIENHAQGHEDAADGTKLFDATMSLKQTQVSAVKLLQAAIAVPLMPLKIVSAIYWQALQLFIKRVPFVPYQNPLPNQNKGEASGASAQSKY